MSSFTQSPNSSTFNLEMSMEEVHLLYSIFGRIRLGEESVYSSAAFNVLTAIAQSGLVDCNFSLDDVAITASIDNVKGNQIAYMDLSDATIDVFSNTEMETRMHGISELLRDEEV